MHSHIYWSKIGLYDPSVEILCVWGSRQVPVQFAVWFAYKWWCFIAHLFPGLILFSQVTAPKCTTLTHWAPLWKQILETELVNDPVPRDFSTQTDIHTWVCVWDREKLHKRYLIQPCISWDWKGWFQGSHSNFWNSFRTNYCESQTCNCNVLIIEQSGMSAIVPSCPECLATETIWVVSKTFRGTGYKAERPNRAKCKYHHAERGYRHRKLELKNRRTHCTQTIESHFRRENFSQVSNLHFWVIITH